VRVAGGPVAALLLVAFAMVLALVIGGFAAMLALRTGSAEAVQNVFPLTFIGLFISSAFFPTELMSGVYRAIARRNPVTWMVDGMRHQVVVGLDWSEAAVALGTAAVLAGLSIWGANRALQSRLRRAA
jgi:ABC-2 type transport system permease protein